MSEEQSMGDIRERLARMEQRQIQLHEMITTSMSNFGDLANRTRRLEEDAHGIKTKLWLAVARDSRQSWEFQISS